MEDSALFERAHGCPKRPFKRFSVLVTETFRGKGVADETLEAGQVTLPHFVQRPVAFWAGERNLIARSFASGVIDIGFVFHISFSVWRLGNMASLTIGKLNQDLSDLDERETEIDVDSIKGRAWHARINCVRWILDDSDTAPRLDCVEAR